MTGRRVSVPYAQREVRAVYVPGQIDISRPVEGYYRHKPRSGAVMGGVRIWYGPPLDPVTGEELDRSWRWMAEFNGEPIDFENVWPMCAKHPSTAEEYARYCQRQTWAREQAPASAYADRTRKYDPLSSNTPLPF